MSDVKPVRLPDIWDGLTAAFGPTLLARFPEYSAIERMHAAYALMEVVKSRSHWFVNATEAPNESN